MKYFFLNLIVVALSSLAFGQVKVTTPIKKVVVYLNGAEVHRESKVNLKKGINEIEVVGLSSSIQGNTIQASLGEGVRILSITHDKELLSNDEKNQRIELKNDSMRVIKTKISYKNAVLDNYKQEEILLEKNYNRIGLNNGVSVVELQKASEYYRTRLQGLTDLTHKITEEIKALALLENQIKKRKSDLMKDVKSKSYRVLLTARSSVAKTSTLFLNYVITEAAWKPKYNIRGLNIDSPVHFEYMAEVFNASGQDWEDVALTLSTGTPFKSMDKPKLTPWTLNYNQYRKDLNYNSAEGYLGKKMALSNSTRGSDDVEYKTAIEVSEVTVDFKIALPYTIPSDSKPYLVEVEQYDLPASYKYYAVPKLEQDAFLIASVTEWEKLNIIDSKANIYYGGKYIGETFIDTRYANDTLELSMGRDSKINISRAKKEDFNKKKWIGLNRRESFEYEISIRNTYATSIDIEILDQVPISQEGDIVVDIINVSEADLDEKSGRLKWNLNIGSSETKKLITSFSVKYPKNKEVKIRRNRQVACPAKFW